MTPLAFLPIALFGVIILLALIIRAVIEVAERRRARKYAGRRRIVFRPVIIKGGKADRVETPPPIAAPDQPESPPGRRKFP